MSLGKKLYVYAGIPALVIGYTVVASVAYGAYTVAIIKEKTRELR